MTDGQLTGEETTRRRSANLDGRVALGVRLTSHVAIWISLFVPTINEALRGWRAVGDNTGIVFWSYRAISLQPRLVGQESSTTAAHNLSSLGPLQYWLLAIPVHLDPQQGALWGAALAGAMVLSLAAEAAWSIGSWQASAVVAIAVADLAWLMPEVFSDLVWNPNFGAVFLIATVVFAWVVATGALRWLPILVACASVTAQSHLIFVPTVVLMTVAALSFGVFRAGQDRQLRERRARWLLIGGVVGTVCWSFPVLQEVTGSPGNLSTLVNGGRGDAVLGTQLSLRLLDISYSPYPIVVKHFPSEFALTALAEPARFPVSVGWAVLACVTMGALLAAIYGNTRLAALAMVCLVYTFGMFISFSLIPRANVLNLPYVCFCWWLVGLLFWATVVAAAAEVTSVGLRSHHSAKAVVIDDGHAAPCPERRVALQDGGGRVRRAWTPVPAGCIAIALVGIVTVLGVSNTAPASAAEAQAGGFGVPGDSSGPVTEMQIQRIAKAIERTVRRGPVAFEIHVEDPRFSRADVLGQEGADAAGVLWQLTLDGRQSGYPPELTIWTAEFPVAQAGWPTVVVTVRDGRVLSAVRTR